MVGRDSVALNTKNEQLKLEEQGRVLKQTKKLHLFFKTNSVSVEENKDKGEPESANAVCDVSVGDANVFSGSSSPKQP